MPLRRFALDLVAEVAADQLSVAMAELAGPVALASSAS
jgi:hypothetical protein